MQLFLNRESPVPLHDQLVAQLGQLVASGDLAPGAKLPSLRALASRLGVHPLTVQAAYKALAERGVVVVKEGSGARVAELAPAAGTWREGLALRAMAAVFVDRARAAGHADAAIREALDAALRPAGVSRLVVVNPHPDLQALYAFELGQRIAMPIAGLTPEEVEAQGAAAFADALLLTSTNFAAPVSAVLGDPPFIFTIASRQPMLDAARALPPDAVCAVVASSPRFVFLARELLAAVLPEERLVGAALDEPDAVASALRMAALVVTDAPAGATVRLRAGQAVHVQPMLAESVFAELTARLAPDAFRPV